MAAAVSHPVFARAFPAMSRALEAGGIAGRRKDLLAGLAGQVIDVGTGTGPGFGHYPAAVTRVLAVEPEPRLRALAAAAARAAPVPIQITGGKAGALPAADASYDAVVSFVLCTVPDQDRRAPEATVWPRPFGGCRLSRDAAAAIERAGITITTLEEFLFPAARTPVSFHIAGHATAQGR